MEFVLEQVYFHYEKWEDYQSGMYEIPKKESYEINLENAKKLLADPDELEIQMQRVVDEWKIATLVNLTNKSCNRKAWLGQSACAIKFGIPEIVTRNAWSLLSSNEMLLANNVAEQIIVNWQNRYIRKLRWGGEFRR